MDSQNTQQVQSVAVGQAAFGQCIREKRQEAGRSLSDLAKALQVTKGYLSRLERGRAKPSKRLIESIARVLEIDLGPLKILAGDLPDDVQQILCRHPEEALAFLREAFGECSAPPPAQKSNNPAKSIPQKKQPSLSFREEPYELIQANCFDWLEHRAPDSIHAVVTDPPYGLKEYTSKEKHKLRRGRGGVWRIPPTLNGYTRSPLPRFTVLTHEEKDSLQKFFTQWALRIQRVLVPGGHVFIATSPLLSHLVYAALEEAGFEKRGEIIRLVQTLRGGDRPKNAHKEFTNVTVMPRSGWEPWGLFRKPCQGRVQDNLRQWKTGGLRRLSEEHPFGDVIKSVPTRGREREIAPHPSLKPQAFMRQVVRASLPLGEGVVLDPFMGGGATIAAARAVGYRSIGVEMDQEYYKMAVQAIPELATLAPDSGKVPTHLSRGPLDQQPALFSESIRASS